LGAFSNFVMRFFVDFFTGLLADEDEHSGGMQHHAEAVGDAFHYGGGVGQTVEGAGDFDQNAGAVVLFAGELVQTEGFEGSAELGRQHRNFRNRVIVEAGSRGAAEEDDGADQFSRKQHGSGQSSLGKGRG